MWWIVIIVILLIVALPIAKKVVGGQDSDTEQVSDREPAGKSVMPSFRCPMCGEEKLYASLNDGGTLSCMKCENTCHWCGVGKLVSGQICREDFGRESLDYKCAICKEYPKMVSGGVECACGRQHRCWGVFAYAMGPKCQYEHNKSSSGQQCTPIRLIVPDRSFPVAIAR